ncbi:MAG: ABC transporter permease [Pseudolysinimonas sp.]|uniref:ABC transporter permease n=1 Tax=Pseudolysinimonas sp. TaxID=2680009 RepID=UPI0032646832
MNSGYPRPSYFLADAVHRFRRPLTPTVIAATIVLAGTVAVFATTGIAVAGQQSALERINSPEGRLITVTDPQGQAGLSPESVAIVSSISGVEWAVGVGPATDVHNTGIPGGTTQPARALYGELPPPIHTSTSRRLVDGLAIAGPGLTQSLSLEEGVGPITGRNGQSVVVGSFVADTPLASLNSNFLVAQSATSTGRLLTLWVSVSDVTQLAQVSAAVRDALITTNPGVVRIDTSSELAQLSADVTADLARTAQLTVSGLLVAVAILIAAVQFGRVTSMAKDIGRARALGATRSTIVGQIVANAAVCGFVGATAGTIAGLIISAFVAHQLPGVGFTVGVGVLMVLASIVGSIGPAVRAARADPVRILRVP